MSTPKGSQDLRAEVFEKVKPMVDAISDKKLAIVVITNCVNETRLLECVGLDKMRGSALEKYLENYEAAVQFALKFHVLPEVVWGYAYRLKLLGMHSSAHALEHALEANAGLFDKELAG